MPQNPVRKSTLDVTKNAEYVRLNEERIAALARKWSAQGVTIPDWPKKVHLVTEDERTMLDYLIVLHSVMFSLWSRNTQWNITHDGEKYNGYFALAIALSRYFQEFPGKANLSYFSNMPFGEFKSIFAGRGRLKFLDQRWINVRKVSLRLLNDYEGDSTTFVNSAGRMLSRLVPKIATELYSFNDMVYSRKKKVYFLMRAQMLATNIIGAFNEQGLGKFKDRDYLTALADYKLPQTLRHLGIIEYDGKLQSRINNGRLLTSGSKEEVEIRAAAISAVEYIKEALRKKRVNVHAYELDRIIWHKGQRIQLKYPHHLTESAFY